MTPEYRQKIRGLLLHHESYRQFPYTDTTGHITIGIGRNLNDRGISEVEAFTLLDDDIMYFEHQLSGSLPYFDALDENRQIALIDMCFNLGVKGMLGFEDMHREMAAGNYELAAHCMTDSKWAIQVGNRATDLATIIRTGSI